jgi:type II secretory pathway component HofQ
MIQNKQQQKEEGQLNHVVEEQQQQLQVLRKKSGNRVLQSLQIGAVEDNRWKSLGLGFSPRRGYHKDSQSQKPSESKL